MMQHKLVLTCLFLVEFLFCANASVRAGFLADYFSRRKISGKLFGSAESSILIGFIIGLISDVVQFLLYKKGVSVKKVIVGSYVAVIIFGTTQGLYSLFTDNVTFVTLSILMRATQGLFACILTLAIIEAARVWFAENFQLVNSMIQLGYYSGFACGQCVGAVLYSRYGYVVPYLATGGVNVATLVMCLVVLPSAKHDQEDSSTSYLLNDALVSSNSTNYSSTNKVVKPVSKNKIHGLEEATQEPKIMKNQTVSWAIFVPAVASSLVNCIYGLLIVTITPYSVNCCEISIAESGLLLLVLSFFLAAGSFTVGNLSQRKIIKDTNLMIIGALNTAIGLFILFPPPSLQTTSLIPAYIGMLLVGFGEPFLSISSLQVMCDVQERRYGYVTSEQKTTITLYWLIFQFVPGHGGGFLGGLFMDYFKFYETACILIGCCSLSIILATISKKI